MVKATNITINGDDRGLYLEYSELIKFIRKINLKFSVDFTDSIEGCIKYLLNPYDGTYILFEGVEYIAKAYLFAFYCGLELITDDIAKYINTEIISGSDLYLQTKGGC